MKQVFAEMSDPSVFQRMAIVVLILWGLMIVAVLVDLWTGIEKAKARREFVDSGGLRRTITKVGEYWRVLAMLLLEDVIGSIFPWYALPYASVLGTLAVILIEGRSVIENLRAKHSAAADIPDAIGRIIRCRDVKQAASLLRELRSLTGEREKTDPGETQVEP